MRRALVGLIALSVALAGGIGALIGILLARPEPEPKPVWQTWFGAKVAAQQFDPIAVIGFAVTTQSIVLAVVGFVIAVAAFWGYANLKDAAEKAARETAISVAADTSRETAESVATRLFAEFTGQQGSQGDYGSAAGGSDGNEGQTPTG